MFAGAAKPRPNLSMIKILLAEDHVLVREGLKLFLETGHDFIVVAETGDGAAVEALVRAHAPDLVVLDLDLPGCRGDELAATIKTQFPAVKVLILTGNLRTDLVTRALAAGADGYVLKQGNSAELLQAVRLILAGGEYVSASVALQFLQKDGDAARADMPTTPREREIMALIAQGLGNQGIADALHLSVFTVRKHRQNLMEKLHLRNAAEITAYAVKQGFYDPT